MDKYRAVELDHIGTLKAYPKLQSTLKASSRHLILTDVNKNDFIQIRMPTSLT